MAWIPQIYVLIIGRIHALVKEPKKESIVVFYPDIFEYPVRYLFRI